ncbi:Hypothetical transmembrane protein [Flavobacterium indicum GPTSA100-9 = DSM 17447]|uniref:Hypothetical transmembrane protein n=1 Tax=Flavobacterium indicum (strain DSM 17447 / CIP 109464 / GPTSA100-9) TaxID=1094466 RepID=H8XUQ3_FLAIG|nr:hypothetical protein [Flavobacterium indicum]CCG53831.1 Hypothetical transmembrane protein [Flavobacterium indicum GPTSA100-9 = DSM 17447]
MIELNEKIEKEIHKLSSKTNSFIDTIFSNPYFKRSTQFGSIISDFKETVVFENTGLKNYLLFIVGFVVLLLGLISIENQVFLLYFLLLLLIEVSIFFYYKFRQKIVITITSSGVELNTSFYNWNEIYEYGFLITPKHDYESYVLLLFLKNETKFSFELNEFNNPEEIIETMNFFRNKFISNS